MNHRILQGCVLDRLPEIEPGSIDCAVTSPPYWMLRSYLPKGHALKHLELGSEKTPAEYVANQVRVASLVREALADHGTYWINVGDTYSHARGKRKPGDKHGPKQTTNEGSIGTFSPTADSIEDGSLCLIPQRLMIALADDGWIVRSIIVWHKPAPMPASITGWRWMKCRVKTKDRPVRQSKTHETENGKKPAGYSEDWKSFASAEWQDCPGCKKCAPNAGLVLRRGSWRPTSSYEPIIMLAKQSQRVSRVVEFADIPSEFVHFGKHLGLHYGEPTHFGSSAPDHWDGVRQVCVFLATAVFDAAQRQNNFSLPPFYAKEWQECFDEDNGHLVRGGPKVHRAAILSARLATPTVTIKQFLNEFYRLGVTLPDSGNLRVGDILCRLPRTPGIFCDGKTTIAVHDAGQICKVDFAHGRIVWEQRSSVPYFADGEPVKTPASAATVSRDQYTRVLDDPDEQFAVRHDHESLCDAGANARDVLRWAAEPLSEKHYAAYPTALVQWCLRAGTSAKGYCPMCGAPWVRILESVDTGKTQKMADGWDTGEGAHGSIHRNGSEAGEPGKAVMTNRTIGWRPSCRCIGADTVDPRPGRVLDPFAGSGRTGIACSRLGLDFTGIELNPDYAKMAERLIREEAPLFATASE